MCRSFSNNQIHSCKFMSEKEKSHLGYFVVRLLFPSITTAVLTTTWSDLQANPTFSSGTRWTTRWSWWGTARIMRPS